MRHRFLTVLTALFIVTLASTAQAERTREQMDNAPQFINGRLMLPKWETHWERMARFKKDTAQMLHDFRMANPGVYGVTAPPLQPVKFYAEYDPTAAIYFAWIPGTQDQFFGDFTHELLVDGSAEVIILHHGAADASTLATLISNRGDDPSQVTFLDVSTLGNYYVWQTEPPYDNSIDSIWTVDFGPFFVEDGSGTLSIIDPRYYFWRINDDSIPHKLASLHGTNVFRPDMGLEGGNMFSDGVGTCFLTGAHVAHNAPYSQQEFEDMLFDFFGCEKTIFLMPPQREGTGHIDMFFKNASATTLVVGEFDAAMDPMNAAILDYNASLLENETNAAGDPFTVLRVPMPSNADGTFRTYTNGIVVNDLVLVPVYPNYPTYETEALNVFQTAFPGKNVVGINSDAIIPWGGAIHCVTRTRPVGTLAQMETPPTEECTGAYQCISGCGDFDFSGDCVYNIAVWCDNGNIGEEQCWNNQRCGWDLASDYFYCVDPGCGGLAPEGECRQTQEGDWVAVTCDASSYPNPYPVGERCPAGTECGILTSTGQAGCRAPCTDDCQFGEFGCDANGDPYSCGEAGDGDDCYEIIPETPCSGDTVCQAGECVCEDECAVGEGGCTIDGDVWICGENNDGDQCYDRVIVPCQSGTHCYGGVCEKDPKKGCGCASAAPGDLGGLLVFALGLLGWLGVRRRRRYR